MMIDESRTRRLFACLGDPSRFRLVGRLIAREFCVTDLAREIGLSQSCTTRHLQTLQREGLVVGLRRGKRVMFRIKTEEPMIAGLVAWALSHPDQAASNDWPDPRVPADGSHGQAAPRKAPPDAVTTALDNPSLEPSRAADASPRRDELEDFLL